MIDKKIYDIDYIRELQARYKIDSGMNQHYQSWRI